MLLLVLLAFWMLCLPLLRSLFLPRWLMLYLCSLFLSGSGGSGSFSSSLALSAPLPPFLSPSLASPLRFSSSLPLGLPLLRFLSLLGVWFWRGLMLLQGSVRFLFLFLSRFLLFPILSLRIQPLLCQFLRLLSLRLYLPPLLLR